METSRLRESGPSPPQSPPIFESPAAGLTADERRHAESILDPYPTLVPIPPHQIPRVLIGSVIRKPPVVVAAFLKTVAWQQLRQPVEFGYSFTTDFPLQHPESSPVRQLLDTFATEHKCVTLRHVGNAGDDYADGPVTRQWTPQAWHRVGALKNQLIQQALDERYDYLWLIDTDVLCDPYTLQSLLDTDCPIVAGVYWTHWQRPVEGLAVVQHAGPQVWLRHPYHLDGHGYTEAEFRSALIARKLLRVWGLGACTLFHRPALEKGVSFTPVPEGLPPGPMGDGEDRHLAERVRRLHLPLYADAWPDIWHAYHASDYGQIDQWLTRFSSPRPVTPSAGDLVSFKVELLEPVPALTAPHMLHYVGPQIVRGRLAQLAVLPEIAEALGHMSPGDRRILSIHYPLHYEYTPLRLQQRMVAVTLLDVKGYTLPPVIGEELFSGPVSWTLVDPTQLTPTQVESVLEEAHAIAS